jgi:hypothetical protein
MRGLMKMRVRIASGLLYAASGVTIIIGLSYLLSPTIMPYHEKFLGQSHEQLDPKVAALLVAMMRAGGALFLSLGLGLAILVTGLSGKGDRRAWWTIGVMSITSLVPLLFITLSIGLFTPWWMVAAGILLVVTALFLSKGDQQKCVRQTQRN